MANCAKGPDFCFFLIKSTHLHQSIWGPISVSVALSTTEREREKNQAHTCFSINQGAEWKPVYQNLPPHYLITLLVAGMRKTHCLLGRPPFLGAGMLTMHHNFCAR